MNKRFRHRYNLIEYYVVIRQAIRSIGTMIKTRHNHTISNEFMERLMLAVTEVNGCEICAYGHTLMALKQGFSKEEEEAFLKGDNSFYLPEETKAILFAQHYADNNGRPAYEAYEILIQEYGFKKSKSIIASIQMMMMGNVIGLPFSAFQSRLKKHPYENSNMFYEIGMELILLPIFPIALIHSIISLIYDRKNIRFKKLQ